MVCGTEAFSSDFASIAATGEYGPMRGVIGRVRLLSPRSALGTYREAGLVIMSAQSSACAGRTRTLVAEPSDVPACYNFLYEIEEQVPCGLSVNVDLDSGDITPYSFYMNARP
jgi:hypothetical protein